MTPLRITIITYNWPPRNAIGTHRPYSWAKSWSRRGATVTVVTARKQNFDAPLDLVLPELPGVRVIEVPYGAFKSGSTGRYSGAWLKAAAKGVVRLVRRLTGVTLDPRMGWYRQALPAVRALALDCDVAVSTYGPAACHLLGHEMKTANPNLFWVSDYRDLWSMNHLVDIDARQRRKLRALEESKVGRHADLLTTVSRDLAAKLAAAFGENTLVVKNGFDLESELLTLPERKPQPEGAKTPRRIVYTGMLYDKHRDPEPLLEALAQLFDEKVISEGEITVAFFGSRLDAIKPLAGTARYGRFIHVAGHVPRDKALAEQSSADLLLILESSSPEARGVITGKVFEYIASGVPIINIGGGEDTELAELLRETGTGITLGKDVAAIKSLLTVCLANGFCPSFFKPDLPRIKAYSREVQAGILLSRIEQDRKAARGDA